MTDSSGPSPLCSRPQGTARTNGSSRNTQEKKVTPTRGLMQTACSREASTMTDPIRRPHTDAGVQTAVDHVDKGTRTSPSPRKPTICTVCQSHAPASPNHQSQGCDSHAPPPPSRHRCKVDVNIRSRSAVLNESVKMGSKPDTGGGGCGSGGCGDSSMSWDKYESGGCGGFGGSDGCGSGGCGGSDGPGGSDSFPLSDVSGGFGGSGCGSNGSGCGSEGAENSPAVQDVLCDDGASGGSGCGSGDGSGGGSGSAPLQDVFWDDRGMTWEVYGASVDPESLGVAIQSHLESKIREQADHIRTLRKSICSESGARAVQEGRGGARRGGGARWYHCCSKDPEEE